MSTHVSIPSASTATLLVCSATVIMPVAMKTEAVTAIASARSVGCIRQPALIRTASLVAGPPAPARK